jgi:RNA polymerase sigma factor (sigma-70 family)
VYARSLLYDHASAEDVAQDCFCSLLRKADDYDLLRDGVFILLKAITNACLKANARGRTVISLDASLFKDGRSGSLEPADDTSVGPPQAVLHAELERAVEEALAELPEMQRAAVELKGLGHSQQEIAEILEVSPSNAGVLIHRGRHALAQRLAPFLEFKPDDRKGKRSAE